ncbi:AarF/ABC1/UbiB kinase family protein [Nevskia sp.]|uniref:AarF/UbiB family protein n=1 Tax=Nevskia sp. TaxID=1929292 RepID=UPI0025E900F6|nr:AarF/ABC1/UbiB kinase family protein [Nevskia sp.]
MSESPAPLLPVVLAEAPTAAPPEGTTAKVRGVMREIATLGVSTVRLTRGLVPLIGVLTDEQDSTGDDLEQAIDTLFVALYRHPLLKHTGRLTQALRRRKLIPDEQSTEDLIRFIVEQAVARSPMPVPEALINEFWNFFNELFAAPELKGLGEMSLDMVRLVVKSYEPLLLEIINLLKAGRRFNQWQLNELLKRAAQIRTDAGIVRRQIRALRYIKPFFQVDPKDYKAQAQLIARMVNEFGPFFVKMAQVAAANADFLPEEIARELSVFHEDVAPMTADEVRAAFMECYGKPPEKFYLGFEADKPLKSGSIGSVYLAKKPFYENNREVLRPVIIKVGRHNIDREFEIGKLVLGLAIMSTQYWAPHSRLAPFLRAMQEQVDEFVAGFVEELDFEAEAANHQRFYQRSLKGNLFRVPELYGSSRRILEMEFLGDAVSLNKALARLPKRQRRQFQNKVVEQLSATVLYHAFAYREIHGDLHPGNVMIGADGRLNLIDWGNVVDLNGKWRPVWDYLAGAILADTDLLTDALIRISTHPDENAGRREEIRQMLEDTLRKKDVLPLTRRSFIREVRRGGMAGLHRRGQTVLQLMANTQQAGLVLKRDYLHLSRSLMALAGSYGSLYEGDSRAMLFGDLAKMMARLPLTLGRDYFAHEIRVLQDRFARRERPAAVPVPMMKPLRERRGPPPGVLPAGV